MTPWPRIGVELDRRGRFGQQLELEAEQPRDGLLAGEPLQEQDIGPQGRGHGQRTIRLAVLWHGCLEDLAAGSAGLGRRSRPARRRLARSLDEIRFYRDPGALQPSAPTPSCVDPGVMPEREDRRPLRPPLSTECSLHSPRSIQPACELLGSAAQTAEYE